MKRRFAYLSNYGKKMMICYACNGSGRYDNYKSPKCEACNGVGKIKT